MDWLQITQALFLGAMLLMLYPRVKQAFKNPEDTSGKWGAVVIPLLIVGIIVVVLIKSVQ